ncbi:DUF1045 domain-containing protein [Oceanomicrobium pacificus]|uniref:DUF1045 domain-containing protein n=1 Tax=Oceanomicrobium pacificus TaxID=2692916 RepID=A0A6B0TRM0_9RHOB|nr:DUF1045 domain-containing protein [Oceanomicrobium pacificus]MXU63852.1 DUF1045 domain-containing protein [Oceanomicrobium pacificus]
MADFRRFAIYHLPDQAALSSFGARWLGWDIDTGSVPSAWCGAAMETGGNGSEITVPDADRAAVAHLTETPRKYGFHATVKPPFRLAEGVSADALASAARDLASQTRPVTLHGLTIARLGHFLALVPDGPSGALEDMAFNWVKALDRFRAPPSDSELDRRRAAGLSARQEALLQDWGYPFVGPEFRFHMTLTGRLADAATERAARGLIATCLPEIPRPYIVASLALVGERPDGRFETIEQLPLTG